MQTFLPHKDFSESLHCLDNKRLGKQRVEAMQILNALEPDSTSKWRNHPAVKMWYGYEIQLKYYHDLAISIWVTRGFRNNMVMLIDSYEDFKSAKEHPPDWLTEGFCAAHRSNLLRKNPKWYGRYGWSEPDNLPYIWPVK